MIIFLLALLCASDVFAARIKDVVRIKGVRDNLLIGYGLVVGLKGTGDSGADVTGKALMRMFNNMGIKIDTEVKSKKPDVIFVPGYYNEVALILKQARGLGIKTPVLGGDGWESEDLVKVAGKDALEGTYYSNHYAPDTKDVSAQGFIEAFKKEYNGELPDAMAALGYDAFNVAIDAMKRAGGNISRDAIKESLAQTKGFKGVTGEISIDKDRNAVKSAVVLQFKDGKPMYFATVNP